MQLLIADNYFGLHDLYNAEARYRRAGSMCPNRFMPLYRLAKMCEIRGDKAKLHEYAECIVDKPVKIESAAIAVMKAEMRKKLRDNDL